NAERVVLLDFTVDAIDEFDAHSIAEETASRQTSRLALVLSIPFYKPQASLRWVLAMPTASEASPESERLQTTFFRKGLPPMGMPKKGALCKLGKFEGS